MSKKNHLVPNQWDLKKAAQTYKDPEKRIRNTVEDSGRKELQNIQAITSLEKEVEETEANIQVGLDYPTRKRYTSK